MKIEIQRQAVIDAATKLSRLAAGRTIPVLNCLLLEAEFGGLRLTASNLDAYASISLTGVDVHTPGAVCLSAKVLRTYLSACVGDMVELEATKTNVVNVRCAKAACKINGLPADEFPPMPKPPSDASMMFDAHALETGLRSVAHAVCTDETRTTICGVYFDALIDGVELVATDGKRLAACTVATGAKGIPSFIMPTAVVGLVLGSLPDAGDVEIRVTDTGWIHVTHDDMTIAAKSVEGQYPNYAQVIPVAKPSARLALDREAFRRGLSRVLCMGDGSDVRMASSATGLTLDSAVANVGESRETFADLTGPDFALAFNGRYVEELLASVDFPQMELGFYEGHQPFTMTAPGFRLVLMPFRGQ